MVAVTSFISMQGCCVHERSYHECMRKECPCPAGTRHLKHLDRRRIGESHGTCQVPGRIGSVLAAERNDSWFKFIRHNISPLGSQLLKQSQKSPIVISGLRTVS